MKKLYHVYVESEHVGEVEGIFDEAGKLLDWWSSNDATWRGEYFAKFMRECGIVVLRGDERHEAWLENQAMSEIY